MCLSLTKGYFPSVERAGLIPHRILGIDRKTHMKHVTHKQIVSGMTTAGPLSILLSRFILWVNGESVESELQQELVRVDDEREAALVEVKYLQGLLAERYEGEWKVTKDGRKRYRKVATKVLVNAWVTESEPLRCDECGDDNLAPCTEPGEEGYFRCAGSCALHKFH